MAKYIALLRGINVSGHNKIKMNDLVKLLVKNEFKNVSTYIQSGNILFESVLEDSTSLENQISTIILNEYGYTIQTTIISSEQLNNLFISNPFLKNNIATDITTLHTTILNICPAIELIEELKKKFQHLEDQFEIHQNIIYLYIPNGYGRTKLTNTLFEKKFSCSSTTRNWKTISKLTELINIS